MNNEWPDLDYTDLKYTVSTVHLWTQIVGKIRLVQTPWINHSWHVTLYVSPRGLTTGNIPYPTGNFQIDFDFVDHLLIIQSANSKQQIELYPRSVASFYTELFEKLKVMELNITIYPRPNEIEIAVPFEEDHVHRHYEKNQIKLLWQALVKIETVFTKFRATFNGKCSPVHFFWGAFDLAVSRFSGRKAPKHPGGAPNMPLGVMQEAYSHEVCSCGFWPGSETYPHPAFYAYCYPTPNEFKEQPVKPAEAFYNDTLGEFILNYDVIKNGGNPEKLLLIFLQSTYDAAAFTGNWDQKSFACDFSELKQ